MLYKSSNNKVLLLSLSLCFLFSEPGLAADKQQQNLTASDIEMVKAGKADKPLKPLQIKDIKADKIKSDNKADNKADKLLRSKVTVNKENKLAVRSKNPSRLQSSGAQGSGQRSMSADQIDPTDIAASPAAGRSSGGSRANDDVIESDIERVKDRATFEPHKAGWRVTSNGGLAYGNAKDERLWIQISGLARLDETLFSGSFRDRRREDLLNSSGHIRLLQLNLDGGVGPCWTYTLQVSYGSGPGGNLTRFEDTWVAYKGFSENSELFLGRISGNWFGLESSTGGTWLPFLERHMAAVAFYPGDGIGAMADMWWDWGCVTLVATQPDHGERLILRSSDPIFANVDLPTRSDRWRGLVRLTVSPIHDKGDVWHFGGSFAYRHHDASLNGVPVGDFGVSAPPGARWRNTFRLLSVGNLQANYGRQYSFEVARQCGPLLVQGEYSHLLVHRVGDPLGEVRFHGWNAQASYILTGEYHQYDLRDGNFGKIDICDKKLGAWELAFRWDYLSLNDKNVHGGSETNATLALNWYVNSNVRLSANYIRANIRPSSHIRANLDPSHRHLDILAMRAQFKFH